MRPPKHIILRHFGASKMVLTKTRLLKHDFPVHGIFCFFVYFWGHPRVDFEFFFRKLSYFQDSGVLGLCTSPAGSQGYLLILLVIFLLYYPMSLPSAFSTLQLASNESVLRLLYPHGFINTVFLPCFSRFS